METAILKEFGGTRVFGRKRHVDLMSEIERGLPMQAYFILSKSLHLAPAEEDRLLQVSTRTRARWRSQHMERIEPAVSDCLVRTRNTT